MIPSQSRKLGVLHNFSTNIKITNKSVFSLAALLSKFRIDYSDLILIADITKKAKEETKQEFEKLIENFRAKDENIPEEGKISFLCFDIFNSAFSTIVKIEYLCYSFLDTF